jgi:hypothetical protein
LAQFFKEELLDASYYTTNSKNQIVGLDISKLADSDQTLLMQEKFKIRESK